jgi:hypothetical protein
MRKVNILFFVGFIEPSKKYYQQEYEKYYKSYEELKKVAIKITVIYQQVPKQLIRHQ